MDVDVGDAGCLQDEEFPAKFVVKLHLNSSCSVIVRVSVVLKRTVGDSD